MGSEVAKEAEAGVSRQGRGQWSPQGQRQESADRGGGSEVTAGAETGARDRCGILRS